MLSENVRYLCYHYKLTIIWWALKYWYHYETYNQLLYKTTNWRTGIYYRKWQSLIEVTDDLIYDDLSISHISELLFVANILFFFLLYCIVCNVWLNTIDIPFTSMNTLLCWIKLCIYKYKWFIDECYVWSQRWLNVIVIWIFKKML